MGKVKQWKQVHAEGEPALTFSQGKRFIDTFAGEGELVSNCSGFTSSRLQGIQIWDGEILSDFNAVGSSHGGRGVECLGVFEDFTAKTYSAFDGDTAEQMVEEGVKWTFGFVGCPVRAGEPQDLDGSGRFPDFQGKRSARNVVGVSASGEPMLLSVYGSTGRGEGLTLNELAVVCKMLGFHECANIDGGGSAQAMVRGRVYHPSADSARRRRVPSVMSIRV
ncbi:phosphodiester glycosidase family protein [Rothia sp. CCM 9417]|uniref:phosphodiester glycosidase family protein n=1 Tax=Rothia sp. CCM 9417 TaxID=3402657 RepID=UPI003AEB5160